MSAEQKVRPALSFSIRIDSADKREVDICGSVNIEGSFPEQKTAKKLDEVAFTTNWETMILIKNVWRERDDDDRRCLLLRDA